ncbi:pyridoxamine 5'-phosphate oxidase family protein [Gynuella sunshinyii]|uniref:Putative flavin-nucleotide-binding protein structurally-like pyridoxine 5'-phosphate oxidase n=1 Tax=Gynuella sunshinyii YC6258 TaxID=1445510 RepID=A0A0C5VIL5_9GAMM|nr:pyridoxamine 5'-phosphate oxidase family protein [Gynuella sunshinyii]AJQ94512.1 putative flavin-nucleotide-binding protein structurally-like pyridoxine 5'-phosphate oxidase [Gynuella sunshinyii YC6258]
MDYISDIAFTKSVKAIQLRKGSRDIYAQMEQYGGWQTEITPELADFVAEQRSFFLATTNTYGQPYVQHRGGPPGFLKVIDRKTLAFADYQGNRQFISQGNLAENPRAFIFLIDYTNRIRIKIWGKAKVIEDSPELLAQLMPSQNQYHARAEQVLVFTVEAWDKNCPQHIPPRIEQKDADKLLQEQKLRIEELEEQVRLLRPTGRE